MLTDASMDLLNAPLSSDPTSSSDDQDMTTSDGSALVANSGFGIDGSDASSTAPVDTGDTITIPSSSAISTYTVQAGDSLSMIAQNYGVSVNTILWANDITDPSTIKEGTKLVILPVSGVQHTVRSGETLSSVAQKYHADASDIAQFNGLPSDSTLVIGSTIIIPGGELPSSSSDSSSSSSSASPSDTSSTAPAKSTKDTKAKDSTSDTSTSAASTAPSSTSSNSGYTNYSDETDNPYKGGSGAELKGYFTNPLPGAILTQGIHGWNAVDLGAHTGTPILAAASGTIILSRMGGWNGGYGNYVIIDNGNGIETLYAHMSQTKATVGDSVSAGDVIGYVGMTGDATGPHLHFEVRGARNPFASCAEMTVCTPE
jgi:murein DD-endopeptidase MepM/ murein hydrolase activator NlpD